MVALLMVDVRSAEDSASLGGGPSGLAETSYFLALSPVCVGENGASPAKLGMARALADLPQPYTSRGTTRLGDRAKN